MLIFGFSDAAMNSAARNPINTNSSKEELITKHELAKRLKLCTRKIELMVNAGEIPAIRIGSSIRFSWEQVIEAIQNSQQS